MSSRSVRKRRHREDFTQYVESRKQWKGLASQWKMFGFPNEIAFMKALIAHQQKQSQEHVHDENCTHDRAEQIQLSIEKTRSEGGYEAAEHQTSELEMWNEVDDNDHHEEIAAQEASENEEQRKLRERIEDSIAADRANLDFLPEEDNE